MVVPLLGCASLLALVQSDLRLPDEPRLRLEALAPVETRSGKGAETVSVQARSARAIVGNSRKGTVEVFDLTRPGAPRSLALHDLGLSKGETLTCVAFHPQHDWFVAAIEAAEPLQPGRIAVVAAADGRELALLPAGAGPDHVSFDAAGFHALVANEGEDFVLAEGGGYRSAPGSLTLITVGPGTNDLAAIQIALPSSSPVPGMTRPEDGRFLERKVGGSPQAIPIDGAGAELLEPEAVAFAPDGRTAFVSLQENNGIARIDVAAGRVTELWGLYTTSHPADVTNDGTLRLDAPLTALREPDGIALTGDGRFLVTADEGDTLPKAGECLPGKPAGGGRTLSVFDAATGAVLGDTGAQLDQLCIEAGLYTDDRSDNKGCEPEMVSCFTSQGRSFALLTLERADALALVDLADPAHPRVVGVSSIGEGGPHEPEGIALYHAAELGAYFAYCANEKSGFLGVARVGS